MNELPNSKIVREVLLNGGGKKERSDRIETVDGQSSK